MKGFAYINNKVKWWQNLQNQFAKSEKVVIQSIIALGERIPKIKNKPIDETIENNDQNIKRSHNAKYNMSRIITFPICMIHTFIIAVKSDG